MIADPFELKMEKTPTLVYIQKENFGVGELYLNGKRVKGLQMVLIKASTKTGNSCPSLVLKVFPEGLADSITK